VVGFVDVKDVLRAEVDNGDAEIVDDIARDILIVPETMAISDLLIQFREDRQQMAAVIDEWGAFEGIATVEDIVEALVGDLETGLISMSANPRYASVTMRGTTLTEESNCRTLTMLWLGTSKARRSKRSVDWCSGNSIVRQNLATASRSMVTSLR